MKKESFDHKQEYKNLSEIFNEIKENTENAKVIVKNKRPRKKQKKNNTNNQKIEKTNSNTSWTKASETYLYYSDKKTNWLFIVFLSILLILWCLFIFKVYSDLSSINFFENSFGSSNSNNNYEINRDSINLKKLTSSNVAIKKRKVQLIEEKEIPFETVKKERSDLPLNEEKIIQEGRNGKENVSSVKTFEKDTIINELVLKKETTLEFVPKLVEVGTSQFLSNIKSHIGDTLYLNSTSPLYSSSEENSPTLFDIKEYLDVRLLAIENENICKVVFNGIEGYMNTDNLTSSTIYPAIIEQNRKQKILLKLNNSMPLNIASGLTSDDFKKVLSDLPNDTTSAFKNNAYSFYVAEKNYKVNGVFLAAFMIKETSWGTNMESLFKKLSIPKDDYSDYSFSDSITALAQKLCKDHLNPTGVSIYGGTYSTGWYYTSPNISGVSSYFSTNNSWSTDIYSYMNTLYKLI